MEKNIKVEKLIQKKNLKIHPVRLTALLYLKEALLEEHYEDCLYLIGVAREFGAQNTEIVALLEDPRRSVG